MKNPVLVVFGGISPEHEVSVVTGLQAYERVDRATYDPLAVFIAKDGSLLALPGLKSRKEFLTATRVPAAFGRDKKGGYVRLEGLGGRTVRPYAAYLALHGGTGEGGGIQGLLETIGIPLTSSSIEGSVIAMNKELTKEALRGAGVPVLPSVRVFSEEVRADSRAARERVVKELTLPLIVKPTHLGSSIGIAIARNEADLERALLEAAAVDREIVVEPFLEGITEFNCAVRRSARGIETSPIERPVPRDAILSFADKYERGGKKSGMASLDREVPAKIPKERAEEIARLARAAFTACRMTGMARIDFMQDASGALYLTELNSIPGSMAFYLWEAAGIPFEEQISEAIEQAVAEHREETGRHLDYQTDILERFVKDGQ